MMSLQDTRRPSHFAGAATVEQHALVPATSFSCNGKHAKAALAPQQSRHTANQCLLHMLALLLALSCVASAAQPLTGFPFQDETLRFQIKWPTGVSLGEGRMQARRIEGGRWQFDLTLDASIPGVTVTDKYRSVATAELCSVEFERNSVHGPRKSRETATFAQDKNSVRRSTGGGGSSEFNMPACARDALTFLYFTRWEMGQGRVPPAGKIVFGGPYDIRLVYTGEQSEKGSVADRLGATVRGPSSNVDFELLFARDAARTPVLIRAPLALGTFSLELTR